MNPHETERIPALDQLPLRATEAPDPLDLCLLIDQFALFGIASVWALLTHHDWIRTAAVLVAVIALTGGVWGLTKRLRQVA